MGTQRTPGNLKFAGTGGATAHEATTAVNITGSGSLVGIAMYGVSVVIQIDNGDLIAGFQQSVGSASNFLAIHKRFNSSLKVTYSAGGSCKPYYVLD